MPSPSSSRRHWGQRRIFSDRVYSSASSPTRGGMGGNDTSGSGFTKISALAAALAPEAPTRPPPRPPPTFLDDPPRPRRARGFLDDKARHRDRLQFEPVKGLYSSEVSIEAF